MLDGNNTGVTLTIATTVPVTISNILITGGGNSDCGGGLFVASDASITLDDGVTITGNQANNGAGVYVANTGRLTMNGGAISSNTSSYDGGGVYLNPAAEFVMNSGTLNDNSCGASGKGAGIYVGGTKFFDVLKMNSNATVSDAIYFTPSTLYDINGVKDHSVADDGYEYYEIAVEGATLPYTIASEESGVEVVTTIDGVQVENSGSLAMGQHTISVAISKTGYVGTTVTKKVKVVKQLQKPALLGYGDAELTSALSCVTPENTSYSSYSTYDVNLDADGNGCLYYNYTPQESGSTVTVKEGATTLANSGSLAVGPHTLTITVSKQYYTTKTFTDSVYVEGVLSDAAISTNGTNTDGNNWQYSYLTNEKMTVNVGVGNTGNTISSITAGGESKSTSFLLGHGFNSNVVITQTRQHCRTKVTTQPMAVSIMPICFSVTNFEYSCAYERPSVTSGGVYISKNDETESTLSDLDISNYIGGSYSSNSWESCGFNAFSCTLNSPSDYVKIRNSRISIEYRCGASWCDGDPESAHSGSVSLAQFVGRDSGGTGLNRSEHYFGISGYNFSYNVYYNISE